MLKVMIRPVFLGQYFDIILLTSQVTLSSPVLNEGELESLLKDPKLKPKVLSTYFNIRKGLDGSLENAIKALCEEADAAVRSGSQLLVLSDRSEALVSSFRLLNVFTQIFTAIFMLLVYRLELYFK